MVRALTDDSDADPLTPEGAWQAEGLSDLRMIQLVAEDEDPFSAQVATGIAHAFGGVSLHRHRLYRGTIK
ncbi:hypothetical protein OG442_17960 [Streptomyces niveus]|uniref:Uncharacterized protein n=1 Tax=Streptomyces niveus TaxID=193462 RepID=A0ABZ2A3J6_STRNV|nr:hypothetical protein [Streptomyces niveus]